MSPEFSVADVLAWARTKPADEKYDFGDDRNCALCQFLKETGRSAKPTVIYAEWLDGEFDDWAFGDEQWKPIPDAVAGILNEVGHNTFGALVKRLEKLCPETPDYARIEAYLVDLESVEA